MHRRMPGLKYKIHLEFSSDPRRQNTDRFQRERMSANVLLTQSMSLELGAGEPWPQDAALFQPFEVPSN
jgi:hypothetical protein